MGGVCVFINEYFVYFVEIRMGSCVKKYCLYFWYIIGWEEKKFNYIEYWIDK